MKDFLLETIKLEEKIRRGALLKDYYSGKITWLKYTEESDKLSATAKSLSDEAIIKPDFRAILEGQIYPLGWWFAKGQH